MTPIEKVRSAVNTLASMYAAWPTGPAVEGQPMPEGLNFGVSLKAVLEAREALSILEGKVLVPREATEEMKAAATMDGLRAARSGEKIDGQIAVIWNAMIQAAEEAE